MKSAKLGLLLLSCAFLAGCGSLNVGNVNAGGRSFNVGKMMKTTKDIHAALNIPPDLEMDMGREAAANLAARHGLYDNEEMLRYVNLVGLSVARHAVRKDITYRFGILNTEDLNAYAAPGGYIFVTKGLMKIISDEAQLAGVLAHEIQHVDREHAIKALRKANLMKAGASVTEEFLRSKNGMQLSSSFIINLIEKGFDRSDEKDADVQGMKLLAEAGYDPTGLPRALEEYHAVEGEAKANRFTARHPKYEDRMEALASVKGLPEGGAVNKKRYLKNVSF